ncbi:MAG: hypothetical protein V3575_01895 [Candidatus Absconditabacteria bacterium]
MLNKYNEYKLLLGITKFKGYFEYYKSTKQVTNIMYFRKKRGILCVGTYRINLTETKSNLPPS